MALLGRWKIGGSQPRLPDFREAGIVVGDGAGCPHFPQGTPSALTSESGGSRGGSWRGLQRKPNLCTRRLLYTHSFSLNSNENKRSRATSGSRAASQENWPGDPEAVQGCSRHRVGPAANCSRLLVPLFQGRPDGTDGDHGYGRDSAKHDAGHWTPPRRRPRRCRRR